MEPPDDDRERLVAGLARLGWAMFRRLSRTYKVDDAVSAIIGLDREQFEMLRVVNYLTSGEVSAFLTDAIPAFLKAIPLAIELSLREDVGYPRGRVDWTRTVTARLQRGGDPTYYIVRRPSNSQNTMPARLVRYVLSDLATLASRTATWAMPDEARKKIQLVHFIAVRALRAMEARGVQPIKSPAMADFHRLRRTRRPEIAAVADLWNFRAELFGVNGEERLRELIGSALFAPENLDDLFEAWCLLQLVGLHLDDGWVLASVQLVGGKRRPRPQFSLARGDETVAIYYQTAPVTLRGGSKYKMIFEDYDLDVSLRRPDIVLDLQTKSAKGRMIVEVKRSRDRKYIVDSVYKVIGYMADFERSLVGILPKAILVVLGGISPLSGYSATSEVWIVGEKELKTLRLPY